MNKEVKLPEGHERRIVEASEMRAIKEDSGKRFIEGYAALFNHRSRLIMDWDGIYFEEIREGAFDNVLGADNLDVLQTFNHSRNKILARFIKENGEVIQSTLELSVDKRGLKYRFEVPNTSLGNDIFEQVDRGDLRESSFVFSVKEESQRWSKTEDGDSLRTIEKFSGLYDTSIVWKGSYSNTDVDVAKRHYENCNGNSCETEGSASQEENSENDEKESQREIAADEMTLQLLKLGK